MLSTHSPQCSGTQVLEPAQDAYQSECANNHVIHGPEVSNTNTTLILVC